MDDDLDYDAQEPVDDVDISPADWWDDLISYAPTGEAAQEALDALVGSGCSRVEILERLRTMAGLAGTMTWPRRWVEAYLSRTERLADQAVVIPTTQVGPYLGDITELQGLLLDHANRIKAYLSASKRHTNPALKRAHDDFTRYVDERASGRQHAHAAVLINLVTHIPRTAAAQRTATSRMNRKAPIKRKVGVAIKRTRQRIDRGWLKLRAPKRARPDWTPDDFNES